MLAHFLPAQGLTMGQLSIRRAYGEFRNWSMLSNSSSSSLEVEMTYSLWTLLAIFSLNKHGAVRWCESEKVGACTLTVRGGSSRVLSAQSPRAQLARAGQSYSKQELKKSERMRSYRKTSPFSCSIVLMHHAQ